MQEFGSDHILRGLTCWEKIQDPLMNSNLINSTYIQNKFPVNLADKFWGSRLIDSLMITIELLTPAGLKGTYNQVNLTCWCPRAHTSHLFHQKCKHWMPLIHACVWLELCVPTGKLVALKLLIHHPRDLVSLSTPGSDLMPTQPTLGYFHNYTTLPGK